MEIGTTNLEQIKRIARVLLHCGVKRTDIDLIVKHPFSDIKIVAIQTDCSSKLLDITQAKDADIWRTRMSKEIDKSKSVKEIILMITKPYRLVALKHFAKYLSEEDYAKHLYYAWISVEAPNLDPNFTISEFVRLFRDANKAYLMNQEERTQLEGLKDIVTVYRGVTQKSQVPRKSLSWTTNKETAQWFANRFDSNGKVYSATIPKERIYAYFLGRDEYEVIIDPRYLTNITKEN